MLFTSLTFLIFISVVLIIYPRLPLRKQNIFLLLAGYFFYGYWDWRFNFLLITSTLVDFYVGKKLETAMPQGKKKLLFLSIAVNLTILGFFKYFNFFIDSTAALLGAMGMEPHLPVLRVILPVGISFYTFKTMGYTIDVYRGKIKATHDLVDYALFVSFFPQLVAGPIDRSTNLLPQIAQPRTLSYSRFNKGLCLILIGYFKKVAIADSLAPIAQKIYSNPSPLSSGELLTGVYAYTFQIYGDFSGYTDIARGVACMLGFQIMGNFNTPYFSRNITDFWRRWHISLSTWFRDYLYISMGGNRKGPGRTYLNLMVTMLLCGLWHGAAWTFVIWGGAHGFYLAVHRFLFGKVKKAASLPGNISEWALYAAGVFCTFHLVAFTWIPFMAPDMQTVVIFLKGIFSFQRIYNVDTAVLFACLLMIMLDMMQAWFNSDLWLLDRRIARPLRYAIIQFIVVSTLAAAVAHVNTITPFIYFQF